MVHSRAVNFILLVVTLYQGFPIGVQGECLFGNNNNESSEYSTHGGYLDIDRPANCSGLLTRWHLCYHSGNSQTNLPYNAYLRVWRPTGVNTYTRMHNHHTVLNFVSAVDTIECIDEDVDEDEQLEVLPGDVIGVYTPHRNFQGTDRDTPLAVYGQIAGGRLIYDGRNRFRPFTRSTIDVTDTESGVRVETGLALHLYVAFGTTVSSIPTPTSAAASQTPIPTSAAVPPQQSVIMTVNVLSVDPTLSPLPPSASPTFILGGNRDINGGGSNDGAIAAGVVVSLLVVTAATFAAVMGILIWRRRSYKQNNYEGSFTAGTNAYESPATLRNIQSNAKEYEIPLDSNVTNYTNGYTKAGHNGMRTIDRPGYYPYPPGEFDSSDEEDGCGQKADKPNKEINSHGPRNIYRSFGPDDLEYCRLMEATANSTTKQVTPVNIYNPPPEVEDQIYEDLSTLEINTISRKAISLLEEVSSNSNATVYTGTASVEPNTTVDVVVKELVCGATAKGRINFLQEAAIAAQFKHPNVIPLLGIVREDNQPMIIMEHLTKGSLLDCLIRMRPSPSPILAPDAARTLLSYSQQIALGMTYLSGKKIVHRDLSAKNVFVSQDNICKIGEFGMSGGLVDSEFYVDEIRPTPVKWMAPEAINYQQFSTASDVWSFGSLLYEIWSLGTEPFQHLPNSEVMREIQSGNRLDPPPGCPIMIYGLMMKCWNSHRYERPSFQELLLSLLGQEEQVLEIPAKDASSHVQAGILGAPLEAGKDMYSELRQQHLSSSRESRAPELGMPMFDNEDYASTPDISKSFSQESFYEDVVDVESSEKPSTTQPSEDIYEDISGCDPRGGTMVELSTSNSGHNDAEVIYDDVEAILESLLPNSDDVSV